MEIKNLFDASVKQEIISRINTLTPESQRQWGKMEVAQMLAHLQVPMGVALGTHTVKGNWFMKLILPLFKKNLYDEKPWKQGLPTDKTFVMTGQTKNFDTEKVKLLDMINSFTEANMINEKHPVFGKLTKEQWSKASWKHIDHHLKQFGA
ncbi:MAG: DUF1569 domain-containing protein [Chitinophagaceae bacterium]